MRFVPRSSAAARLVGAGSAPQGACPLRSARSRAHLAPAVLAGGTRRLRGTNRHTEKPPAAARAGHSLARTSNGNAPRSVRSIPSGVAPAEVTERRVALTLGAPRRGIFEDACRRPISTTGVGARSPLLHRAHLVDH